MSKFSRRDFLKAGAAVAGFSILPNWVIGNSPAPSKKLNVAIVGPGGRGGACVKAFSEFANSQIVAFCDVDDARVERAYKRFPDVARFKDYRVMLDKMGKDIDAVAIATPDHTHYPIAAWAMANGKHVYVEKPLARTLWETQELKRIATKTGLITQMGNQGHTGDGWRKLKAWFDGGLIGDVVEIHHWTDRPVLSWWKQGELPRPDGSDKVPEALDFKLWLNVAPDQPYGAEMLPFKWRGLRDFGTSALGDMGCHFIDWGYSAFDLGFPEKMTGTVSKFNDYSWPEHSNVVYEFPAKGKRGKVKLFWYDFGDKPKNVKGIPQSVIDSHANGSIVVGTKESVFADDPYGGHTTIYPRERMRELLQAGSVPQNPVAKFPNNPHYEWADACVNGIQPGSNIAGFSADFTAVVMMGLITNFFPGQTLDFDAKKMEFTNVKDANKYIKSLYEYKAEFLPGKI